MRHHMCPDEAFGMVFNLDNVIANTKKRQQAAWHRLAQLEGLPPPKPDRPLFDLRPERVITEVGLLQLDPYQTLVACWRILEPGFLCGPWLNQLDYDGVYASTGGWQVCQVVKSGIPSACFCHVACQGGLLKVSLTFCRPAALIS